ncbi:MAG TPA: ATP synthase F0 subunit B [Thermoanaerobaculia bacterium]|nr:ATP synthase F0 subunit B [Thermoanaerobaculia bacterium]
MIELKPDITLLVIAAIFIATYFIVKRFLVEPITEVLDWRASRVHEADEMYEDAIARLHESTEEASKKLGEARREAAEVRDRHRSEAGTLRDSRLGEVREDAARMIDQADSELSQEVTSIRSSLETESENLAAEMVQRILGRKS